MINGNDWIYILQSDKIIGDNNIGILLEFCVLFWSKKHQRIPLLFYDRFYWNK